MANKITYGLKNLHIAMRLDDDSAGEPTWDTPVAIPGVIGFKPTTEGEEVKQYADNIVYFTATTNNGYTADLETALIPDAVLADILNWVEDANGALVEDADALPAPFALMGQVEGDDKNRRFVYYECRAARPEREEKTKEATITPATDTIRLTITPIVIGDMTVTKAVMQESDTNTAEYAGFFEAVYTPVEDSV